MLIVMKWFKEIFDVILANVVKKRAGTFESLFIFLSLLLSIKLALRCSEFGKKQSYKY